MFSLYIKSIGQHPPRGGRVMMKPKVPAGLFVLVSVRVLTLELNPFAGWNTNPPSYPLPSLDIFHYSSDVIKGKC
jgi:hypothetical protein